MFIVKKTVQISEIILRRFQEEVGNQNPIVLGRTKARKTRHKNFKRTMGWRSLGTQSPYVSRCIYTRNWKTIANAVRPNRAN